MTNILQWLMFLGSGMRHEAQALPSESQKLPLEWKSHDFDQVSNFSTREILMKII